MEQPDVGPEEAAPVLPGRVQLSQAQQVRLSLLEARIARGLSAFLDVAEALWEIKTQGLFRGTHRNFDAYCEEKWHFRGHHAARLLRSFDVAHLLQENDDCPPLPANLPEKLLRPLCPLAPPLQIAVWRLANQVSDGPPESRIIDGLVRAVQHAINRGVKGENGTTASKACSSTSHRHEQKDFFTTLHQLASSRSGFSAYLVVGQINETTAKSHLAACQRVITMCHETIEQMRMRFPWL
jgi:hypothetical protein